MIKFQCPDDPFYVIFMDLFCAYRVYFFQHLVQIMTAFFLYHLLQFFAIIVFTLCLGKINISCNCLDVKSGSTYQNRNMSICINLRHGFFCHLLKFYNMKFFIRFQYIYQVMGHTIHFAGSDFGRADIHMPIHLHRICGNDLTADCLGKGDGQFCFSYSSRAG